MMDNNQKQISEKEALLALTLVPNLGSKRIRKLINQLGSAVTVLSSPIRRLEQVQGIGRLMALNIANNKPLKLVQAKISSCEKRNIKLILAGSTLYPKQLKRIGDVPMILYQKGVFEFRGYKTIGIVGTRKITNYGIQVVKSIVEQLKEYKVATISGLAYGVDILAHRESIKHDIPTVAVIAGGHDQIYPNSHIKDAKKIMLNKGAIISEYLYDSLPIYSQFPARNKIIAGLSDVLIVVESAERGGALITAEIADSYDIPVYAVPGNLDQKYSQGCNTLMHYLKARIFISVELMMQELGWIPKTQQVVIQEQLDFVRKNCSKEENIIIDLLEKNDGVLHIDKLNWLIREKYISSAFTTSSHVLNLKLKKVITSLPGNKLKLSKLIDYKRQ